MPHLVQQHLIKSEVATSTHTLSSQKVVYTTLTVLVLSCYLLPHTHHPLLTSTLSPPPHTLTPSLCGRQAEVEPLRCLFEKYLEKTLVFKRSSCKELVSITELNGVASLCRLYDALATPDNGVRDPW